MNTTHNRTNLTWRIDSRTFVRRQRRILRALSLIGLLTLCVQAEMAGPTVRTSRTSLQAEAKTVLEGVASPTPQDFFRAHLFEEPLIPIGGEPTADENAALAAALSAYARRTSPDDFSSLTDFLSVHPNSPWRAALLTDLGFEYYNSAHYSLVLDAWSQGWALSKEATDLRAKALADRAVGELSWMYARLGRMSDLEPLLN